MPRGPLRSAVAALAFAMALTGLLIVRTLIALDLLSLFVLVVTSSYGVGVHETLMVPIVARKIRRLLHTRATVGRLRATMLLGADGMLVARVTVRKVVAKNFDGFVTPTLGTVDRAIVDCDFRSVFFGPVLRLLSVQVVGVVVNMERIAKRDTVEWNVEHLIKPRSTPGSAEAEVADKGRMEEDTAATGEAAKEEERTEEGGEEDEQVRYNFGRSGRREERRGRTLTEDRMLARSSSSDQSDEINESSIDPVGPIRSPIKSPSRVGRLIQRLRVDDATVPRQRSKSPGFRNFATKMATEVGDVSGVLAKRYEQTNDRIRRLVRGRADSGETSLPHSGEAEDEDRPPNLKVLHGRQGKLWAVHHLQLVGLVVRLVSLGPEVAEGGVPTAGWDQLWEEREELKEEASLGGAGGGVQYKKEIKLHELTMAHAELAPIRESGLLEGLSTKELRRRVQAKLMSAWVSQKYESTLNNIAQRAQALKTEGVDLVQRAQDVAQDLKIEGVRRVLDMAQTHVEGIRLKLDRPPGDEAKVEGVDGLRADDGGDQNGDEDMPPSPSGPISRVLDMAQSRVEGMMLRLDREREGREAKEGAVDGEAPAIEVHGPQPEGGGDTAQANTPPPGSPPTNETALQCAASPHTRTSAATRKDCAALRCSSNDGAPPPPASPATGTTSSDTGLTSIRQQILNRVERSRTREPRRLIGKTSEEIEREQRRLAMRAEAEHEAARLEAEFLQWKATIGDRTGDARVDAEGEGVDADGVAQAEEP